jgi:hypothetical protein
MKGINSRGTGNLLSRTGNLQRLAGNCPPCAGIRAEAQSDARPSPHGPRVDQSGAQSYSEASTGAFYWARKFEGLRDQVKLRSSRTKRGESRVPLRGKRNSRLERAFNGFDAVRQRSLIPPCGGSNPLTFRRIGRVPRAMAGCDGGGFR